MPTTQSELKGRLVSNIPGAGECPNCGSEETERHPEECVCRRCDVVWTPPAKPAPYDVTGAIIAYEEGSLDEAAIVELFQYLINTGLAWSLQGNYGRTAASLVAAGKCNPKSDAWSGE